MPEVVIKYKNTKFLQAIKELAKTFELVIEKRPPSVIELSTNEHQRDIPITFSDHPDVTALSGIWKEKNISLKVLRKKAWGR